jgi:hypothetical protein
MFISLNVEPETHDAEVAALDACAPSLKRAAFRFRTVSGVTGC